MCGLLPSELVMYEWLEAAQRWLIFVAIWWKCFVTEVNYSVSFLGCSSEEQLPQLESSINLFENTVHSWLLWCNLDCLHCFFLIDLFLYFTSLLFNSTSVATGLGFCPLSRFEFMFGPVGCSWDIFKIPSRLTPFLFVPNLIMVFLF